MNHVPAFVLAFGLAGASTTPVLPGQIPAPPIASDANPDPRVFETVLIATIREVQLVPGKKTRMMTYNGTVPGPTIHAELGDTVIVHLVNLLAEPTTIHWHGIETPSVMDGSELSQAPVPASGHHRYEFVANNAGTYWYHPHSSTNTNEQIERGLYGAVIVRDPRHDQNLGIPAARDVLVFLDDIKLDDDNQLAAFSTDPTAEFVPWQRAEDLVNSRVGTHMLINGRWVDPQQLPELLVETGVPYRLRFISATSGHLWRLSVGLQHARWYAIGSDQGLWNKPELIRPIGQVKDVRGHHNQDISDPDPRVGATLTPGDRLETVMVPHGSAGAAAVLEGHDFIKGKHVAFRDPTGALAFGHDHFDGAGAPLPLIRFRITGAADAPGTAEAPGAADAPGTAEAPGAADAPGTAAAPGTADAPGTPAASGKAWRLPDQLRWDPTVALEVDRSSPPLPVLFGHSLPSRDTGDVMFFLNVTRAMDLLAAVHARQVALPIDYLPLPMMRLRARDGYHVKYGTTHCWEVVNFTGSDHNFHCHGFPFQHLETEYIDLDQPDTDHKEPARRLAFEDTIRVPKRPGLVLGRSYTIMRLAVRFDDNARPAALRRRVDQLVAGGLAPGVDRSGGWLLHCHFLEHGSKGMMSFITLER